MIPRYDIYVICNTLILYMLHNTRRIDVGRTGHSLVTSDKLICTLIHSYCIDSLTYSSLCSLGERELLPRYLHFFSSFLACLADVWPAPSPSDVRESGAANPEECEDCNRSCCHCCYRCVCSGVMRRIAQKFQLLQRAVGHVAEVAGDVVVHGQSRLRE